MQILNLFWQKPWRIAGVICLLWLTQSCFSADKKTQNGGKVALTHQKQKGTVISVGTWNLENFGHSKTNKEIAFIANRIADLDIIAIQEVVGKSGGADAVIRLAHHLDYICKSCHWDYAISLRTTGSPYQSERYAYLWQRSKVTHVGLGWLDKKYEKQIEREPFLATFKVNNKTFTIVSFHAIPKSRQPETEIKYLKFFPIEYPNLHLIFLGDFNTPQTNTVFNPLKKMGYQPALVHQKTSLRQECIHGDCLASEYDNIFYPKDYVKFISSEIIPFYTHFNGNMKAARKISDHVPVVLTFKIKSNQ